MAWHGMAVALSGLVTARSRGCLAPTIPAVISWARSRVTSRRVESVPLMSFACARTLWSAVVVAVVACVSGGGTAHGQGVLGASGFSPLRTTHAVAPFEHVDPFSGNLLLTFTDLELPGNAGMSLRVQRVYNSKMSDGSGHSLMNAMANPDNAFGTGVTPDLWRYNRTTHNIVGADPEGLMSATTATVTRNGNTFTTFFDEHYRPIGAGGGSGWRGGTLANFNVGGSSCRRGLWGTNTCK